MNSDHLLAKLPVYNESRMIRCAKIIDIKHTMQGVTLTVDCKIYKVELRLSQEWALDYEPDIGHYLVYDAGQYSTIGSSKFKALQPAVSGGQFDVPTIYKALIAAAGECDIDIDETFVRFNQSVEHFLNKSAHEQLLTTLAGNLPGISSGRYTFNTTGGALADLPPEFAHLVGKV